MPGCEVGAQSLSHRAQDLDEQPVAGLDGIAELGVAHHEQLGGSRGRHGGGGRPTVQHADLTEKISGLKGAPRFAVDLYVRFTVEQDVEGVARTALRRQLLTGFHVDFVGSARDELKLLLGELREERHPAQMLCLGITHGLQHIVLQWQWFARSAAAPSRTGPASARTAGPRSARWSGPRSGSWSRSSSPTSSTRPAWAAGSIPSGLARSWGSFSALRLRSCWRSAAGPRS